MAEVQKVVDGWAVNSWSTGVGAGRLSLQGNSQHGQHRAAVNASFLDRELDYSHPSPEVAGPSVTTQVPEVAGPSVTAQVRRGSRSVSHRSGPRGSRSVSHHSSQSPLKSQR